MRSWKPRWIERRQLLTHKFLCLIWRHTALLRRNYKQFCCQSGIRASQGMGAGAVFSQVPQALPQLLQLFAEGGFRWVAHGRCGSFKKGLND